MLRRSLCRSISCSPLRLLGCSHRFAPPLTRRGMRLCARDDQPSTSHGLAPQGLPSTQRKKLHAPSAQVQKWAPGLLLPTPARSFRLGVLQSQCGLFGSMPIVSSQAIHSPQPRLRHTKKGRRALPFGLSGRTTFRTPTEQQNRHLGGRRVGGAPRVKSLICREISASCAAGHSSAKRSHGSIRLGLT